MIIEYRKPWNIDQNRIYDLTDVKCGPSMQKDFTFYIRMKMRRNVLEDNGHIDIIRQKGIFVRPGLHYGLFGKIEHQGFSWDWWLDGEPYEYESLRSPSLGELMYDEWMLIITHYYEDKKFVMYGENQKTKDFFRVEKKYAGDLVDYTNAPFHFGFANYTEEIAPEHIGFCTYELLDCGLFTQIHSEEKIKDMVIRNQDCYRKPNKMLDGAIFVLNPREKTQWKVWDFSGNSMHLEYNLVLNAKLELI